MSTTEAGMTDRKTSSVDMNPTTDSSDELDNQRKASLPSSVALDPNGNGSRRGQLVHSVSIIVEPVLDDMEPLEEEGKDHLESSFLSRKEIMTSDTTSSSSFESQQRLLRKERIHSSPTIVMDDPFFGSKDKSSDDENTVRSIFQTARLRKEEFARLLEEHAQLVNEINRVETSLV